MSIDPYRLVVFFHVLMFCYWLGADLGVWLCGRAARRPGISDEARALVRKVGHLIDMGPRSALVLIFPAGLILASQYGSPVQGLGLVAAVLACGVWLWMVWTIYLQPQTPLGRTVWKIDLGFRALLMVTLIGFGVSCLVTGGPIQDRWLAAKIVVFGLILLTGIFLRIALFRMDAAARAGKAPPPGSPPTLLQKSLLSSVLVIWALVAIAAFLGVVKPF